jgi:Tfp pilus assembly protein PilP
MILKMIKVSKIVCIFLFVLISFSPVLAEGAPQSKPETERYSYDSAGKRDPFKPFNLSPEIDLSNRADLERYPLDQLRLTAVLDAAGEPLAVIENRAGRGYNVKKGSKVGIHGGEIIEILPDKILILETSTDFTGNTSTKTIELLLRK